MLFSKQRLAALFATAAVAGVVPALGPAASGPVAPATAAAHTCGRGTHAVMPDRSHKCLARGQFCRHTSSWQRVYRSKGFSCSNEDSRGNWHLT